MCERARTHPWIFKMNGKHNNTKKKQRVTIMLGCKPVLPGLLFVTDAKDTFAYFFLSHYHIVGLCIRKSVKIKYFNFYFSLYLKINFREKQKIKYCALSSLKKIESYYLVKIY
jgi:hypothetical protein